MALNYFLPEETPRSSHTGSQPVSCGVYPAAGTRCLWVPPHTALLEPQIPFSGDDSFVVLNWRLPCVATDTLENKQRIMKAQRVLTEPWLAPYPGRGTWWRLEVPPGQQDQREARSGPGRGLAASRVAGAGAPGTAFSVCPGPRHWGHTAHLCFHLP